MTYGRSLSTTRVAELLSDTPLTVRDMRLILGLSVPTIQNSVHTLLAAGEAQEHTVIGQFGKLVRGFTKPQPKIAKVIERGEYTGERWPSRYVPREQPGITLGCIGVDRESTPAGGGESVQ